MLRADDILETAIYAENLEETAAFYERVLGLTAFARGENRHVFFRCKDRVLLLFKPSTTANQDFPPHGARGPGHVAFALRDADHDAWCAQLQAMGVQIEKLITWSEGARSIYFRDPAGNSVELASPKLWGIAER